MSDNKTVVSLDDGKYEITMQDYSESTPYSFTATRYNGPWRNLASEGDNLIYLLFTEVIRLQEELSLKD